MFILVLMIITDINISDCYHININDYYHININDYYYY